MITFKFNNEQSKELRAHFKNHILHQVKGDGLCGYHSLQYLLDKNRIKYDSLAKLQEVGNCKDWFDDLTLLKVARHYGLDLLLYRSEDDCPHMCTDYESINSLQIINYYGNHYDPMDLSWELEPYDNTSTHIYNCKSLIDAQLVFESTADQWISILDILSNSDKRIFMKRVTSNKDPFFSKRLSAQDKEIIIPYLKTRFTKEYTVYESLYKKKITNRYGSIKSSKRTKMKSIYKGELMNLGNLELDLEASDFDSTPDISEAEVVHDEVEEESDYTPEVKAVNLELSDLMIEDNVNCCTVPGNLQAETLFSILHAAEQFYNGNPQLECLFNFMKLLDISMDLIDKSEQLPGQVGLIIKTISKFRHDFFSYYFLHEVIGLDVKFGTDCLFPEAAISNRTPDHIVLKERNITIYEFTVVASHLTANFLKGTGKEDSKYKLEISNLEADGYSVVYKPVYLSLKTETEELFEVWRKQGFEISDRHESDLSDLKSSISLETLYLYSLMFDDFYYTKGVSRQPLNNLKWEYKRLTLDKSRFYQAFYTLKQFDLEDRKYNFSFKKHFMIMPTSISDGHGRKLLEECKVDQIKFYGIIKDLVRGREEVVLQGLKFFSNEVAQLPLHGEKFNHKDHYSNLYLNNLIKSDAYSMHDVDYNINKLWQLPNGDLTEVLTTEKLRQSVEVYEKDRAKYLREDMSIKPPIVDNRRRSFVNLLSGEHISLAPICKPEINDLPDLSVTTKKILSLLGSANYDSAVNEDLSFEMDKHKELKSRLSKFMKSYPELANCKHAKIRALIKTEDVEKFDEFRKQIAEQQKLYSKVVKKNRRGIVRISRDLKNEIKKDMNWGRESSYNLSMVQESNLDDLCNNMLSCNPYTKFEILSSDNIDTDFFLQLKQETRKDMNTYLNELVPTNMFQRCWFHSRLCYTLMNASGRSYNSDYLLFDNLGMTNVILIIKGGKKITTTRKSKIFKLIYPCDSVAVSWQQKKCLKFNAKGVSFEETPWMQYSQSQLLNGLALPYKLMQNYLYCRNKYSKEISFSMVVMPTILGLSDRRSTEKSVHNMRYLIVNAIGLLSQVGKMLEEFSRPAYTNLELCIYNGLGRNYLSYYETIQEWAKFKDNSISTMLYSKVCHPYLNRIITSVEDITYIVYSTYMMSTGNYTQSVEQVINMESIMETHQYYFDKFDDLKIQDTFSNISDLYSNDFNFSPCISYSVGKILTSELKLKHASTKLSTKYKTLSGLPVDDLANNKGLRYKGKDFFGHKGYYVVYKELIEKDLQSVINVINTEESHSKRYYKLKAINNTYETEKLSNNLEKVIFHVVDKRQRAGGREIYVMDYITKLYQRPIELMFKYICEFISNEIITVPAARRAGLIYRSNFEYIKEGYQTYYMSYDCRKWAPRSNPDKYIMMLRGMHEVLPMEFIEDVTYYFNKHKEKQIHTRKHIKTEVCKRHSEWEKYWIDDEETSSCYFNMPYSFVMGIFNMLSSMYHAGVQILAKKYIEEKNFSNGVRSDFTMLAHSDDSAGRISYISDSIESKNLLVRDISFYQHLQKSCNHLMSVKKCNTSETYFELLSTLFINKEFMSVMPKFLSNFSSVFTGKGISADFKQIISKSIELQTNGCDCKTVYMCQLVLSRFYRDFYRVNHDFTIPALGGTAQSWPSLYLAYGAAADELRVSTLQPNLYSKIVNFALRELDFEMEDGTVNLKMMNRIKLPKAYKDIKENVELPEFVDNEWFFQQNKTNHSGLNIFWFRSMLENSDFQVSLLNINEIRRYFDSLYMASGRCIKGKVNVYGINELLMKILITDSQHSNYFKYLGKFYNNFLDFYNNLDDIGDFEIVKVQEQSLKPCSLSMDLFTSMPITEYKSLELATTICRPELLKWINTRRVYNNESAVLKTYLQEMGIPLEIKLVKRFLDFASKYKSFTASFYASVPRTKRVYKNDQGLFDVICSTYTNTSLIRPTRKYRSSYLKKTVNVSDDLKLRVGLQMMSVLSSKTFDDDILFLPVHYKGKTVPLKDATTLETTELGQGSQFLSLIGNFDGCKIDLHAFHNWALWLDRQHKIADEWLGDGTLLANLEGNICLIKCHNDIITEISLNIWEERYFSRSSDMFLNLLLDKCKLRFAPLIAKSGLLNYFGYNNLGNFGIHCANEAAIGAIVRPLNDDFSWLEEVNYHYSYGRHIISKNFENWRLDTMDSLVIEDDPISVFKLINWDAINPSTQSSVLSKVLSGNWGFSEGIGYYRDQVQNDIRSTELYKLLYNKIFLNGYKETLSNIFWMDMVEGMIAEDRLLPLMFEESGAYAIQKLLPYEKKDTILLSKYFSSDNPDLFKIRQMLNSVSSESEVTEIYSKLLLDLKDVDGLSTLPDIGDPEAFQLWKHDSDTATAHWITAAVDLSNALVSGFRCLNLNIQVKIQKKFGQFTYKNVLTSLIDDPNTPACIINDYCVLTTKSMCLHDVMKEIHLNRPAFLDFTRSLRKTALSMLPRHPRYADDWQTLLANFHKFFRCYNFESTELFPPETKRHFRQPDRKEAVAKGFGLLFNVNYKNDIPVSYFYLRQEKNNDFSSDKLDFENNLRTVDDYSYDRIEEDFHYKRTEFYTTGIINNSSRPSYPETEKFFSGPWFIPTGKPIYRKKDIFFYNINEDVARNMGLVRGDFRYELKSHNDYIKYYRREYEFLVMETEKKSFKFPKMDLHYEVFPKLYQLHDPESYTDDLLNLLCDKYKISPNKRSQLGDIIFSNKTPLRKATLIRQKILSLDNSKFDMDKVIEKCFAQNFKSEINVKQEVDFKQLLNSVHDKSKLLFSATNYKAEYKQLQCYTEKLTADLILGLVKLPKHKLESFKSSLNSMLRYYKGRSEQKNIVANLRVMKAILLSAVEDVENVNGQIFEDMFHDFMSKMVIPEIDDESPEEIDPPIEAVQVLKLNLNAP